MQIVHFKHIIGLMILGSCLKDFEDLKLLVQATFLMLMQVVYKLAEI